MGTIQLSCAFNPFSKDEIFITVMNKLYVLQMLINQTNVNREKTESAPTNSATCNKEQAQSVPTNSTTCNKEQGQNAKSKENNDDQEKGQNQIELKIIKICVLEF